MLQMEVFIHLRDIKHLTDLTYIVLTLGHNQSTKYRLVYLKTFLFQRSFS